MKRAITSFILLLFFFVSAFCVVVAQPAPDSWSMFRHDSTGAGYSTSVAPTTNQTLWSYTSGNGRLWSCPAVVSGKLYVGSWDNNIYCLNASTGVLLWKHATAGAISSSPAVVNSKVYVGSQDNSVYCLDASNGNQLWKYTTDNWVVSSPVVVNEKVYFGSRDTYVYCLDASTGDLIWSSATDNYVQSSPAIADGKVYIGTQGNTVYCLDAASGAFIWNFSTNGYVFASPAVVGGRGYVGSMDFNVYCLDASNGGLVWKYATAGAIASPAVAEGRVYAGSEDGNLYCLDASTGDQIWNFVTGPSSDSPVVADGKVYIGSAIGEIYCLNSSNGVHIWKYHAVDGNAVHFFAVADSNVYVTSGNGTIYAFGYKETLADITVENVWNPQPENAAVATVVTAVTLGIASIVVSAASNPAGTSVSAAATKGSDLIPEILKKWLADFLSTKRKKSIEQKTKSTFAVTKPEILAYGVSLTVLTISFSYVKVPDFTQMLVVAPTILATAVIVEFVKTFSSVAIARRLGVWTEHRLWYFGLIMFLITTFAFGVPFSSPSRALYQEPKLTKRREGMVYSAAIIITLAFAALFFILLVSGFTLIGSTGLAMCTIMAFLDTFPVSPMNGKAIYDHNKVTWATLFVATLAIYLSWLILM